MDALTTPPGNCPELPKPRSFWQRIADRFMAIVGARRPATPPEKSVAFTIAIISLGAKLAKADGAVARSEVAAFRRLFIIPRAEEKNAARVFDLARQDVAGFDAWAHRIARMFPPGDPVLADIIEGLFIIAVADSELHEAEIIFIDEVALPEARKRWRDLVRESHPDRAIARGLPPEAIRLAEARTRALNEAWETFRNMCRARTA